MNVRRRCFLPSFFFPVKKNPLSLKTKPNLSSFPELRETSPKSFSRTVAATSMERSSLSGRLEPPVKRVSETERKEKGRNTWFKHVKRSVTIYHELYLLYL